MLKLLLLFVLYPAFSFAHEGAFHVFSKDFKGREVHVYLPEGYDSGRNHYPVLYMHDGQNIFDTSRGHQGKTWNAQETLNQLIKKRLIRPVVVVAVDNSKQRTFDYTHDRDSRHGGGGADHYLDMIVRELMPAIEKHVRVKKESSSTGMMGSSLGGLVSLYAGGKYPHIFGLVGALSPSLWWNNASILSFLKSSSDLPQKIYVDSGTFGGERPEDVKRLHGLLHRRLRDGLRVYIGEGDDHSEKAWAKRFPFALIHLFPY